MLMRPALVDGNRSSVGKSTTVRVTGCGGDGFSFQTARPARAATTRQASVPSSNQRRGAGAEAGAVTVCDTDDEAARVSSV